MRLRGLAAALAVLALGLAEVVHAAAPNVLLVVTDDQRFDELEHMPTLQGELVAKGVTFERAFAVDPLCCPARATLMTGQWPHAHGVWRNNGTRGGMRNFDHSSTLATWLQAAGYRTGWFGKWFNDYRGEWVPPGWDRWVAFSPGNNGGNYTTYTVNVDGALETPGGYSTDYLAGEADAFLRADDERPFFAVLAPFAPHKPYLPAERHADALAEAPIAFGPAVNEQSVRDKPALSRRAGLFDLVELERGRRDRLRTLLAVDEALARLLGTLAADGRLAETLVLYTTDNGFLLGEHRLEGKEAPYDEAARVPFVARYDPLTTPRTEGRIVGNVDIAPTIAELAGVEAPGAEGASLAPLLAGDDAEWRSEILLEHWIGRAAPRKDVTPKTFCALRSESRLYVQYVDGAEELYDLDADPHQLSNVAGSPARAAERHELRLRLREACRPGPPDFAFVSLCTRRGSQGRDVLRGTKGFDVLCGLRGSDLVTAGNGRDVIYPGPGRDTIRSGSAADVVHARDGHRDDVVCGPGPDVVYADRGDRVSATCETVLRR